ncbi:protein translocase subunit SecD [Georgenia sp. MJ170]|uniref:protein translocase subunit SecD n=1 Tax=Georgenia sunbinii TaxID=3117728 RepID=UPI002F2606E4
MREKTALATTARPARRIVLLVVLLVAMFGSIVLGQQLIDDPEDQPGFSPGLALDLEGGVQLILTPRIDEDATTEDLEITSEDISQAIGIIRQRVDASGVAEAEITRQGAANIVVGLPGNPDEATLDLVRQSAQLRFRPVLMAVGPEPIDTSQPAPGEESEGADAAPDDPAFAAADEDGDGELSTTPATEPMSNSDINWVTEQVAYDMYTLDCTDPANLVGGMDDDAGLPLVSCSSDGQGKFVLGPVDVEGTQVSSATSGIDPNTSEWLVSIAFGSEGTTEFAETSRRLVAQQPPQNQFGIVLDGLVISAPRMNQVIPNGEAQISGSFNRESANTLANQLNFGSLPLNFEVQSEEQISATLGSEQLRNGLIAGLIGLVLVAGYLVWQYRGLAFIAVSSLVLAAVIVYGAILVLSWLQGYRLSLAGVAGLIIAVGITADSFILYFERVRDEVREGRTLENAVKHGWDRAKRTIVISDLVTLLAAVVLYFLAVGGVRGFAFTLGLTTLIDLLVVFFFTHPLLQLLIRTKFFGEGHKLSGLNPESLGVSRTVYLGRGRVERRPTPDRPKKKSKKSVPDPAPADEPRRGSIAERRAAERRENEQHDTDDGVADAGASAGTDRKESR